MHNVNNKLVSDHAPRGKMIPKEWNTAMTELMNAVMLRYNLDADKRDQLADVILQTVHNSIFGSNRSGSTINVTNSNNRNVPLTNGTTVFFHGNPSYVNTNKISVFGQVKGFVGSNGGPIDAEEVFKDNSIITAVYLSSLDKWCVSNFSGGGTKIGGSPIVTKETILTLIEQHKEDEIKAAADLAADKRRCQ